MAMRARQFTDLEVWRRAFDISLDVHKTSLTFPKIEQYVLGDQVRRASKSICANIAEGFGRQVGSTPEFKRFLQMALGSSNEMLVWVRYCKELGYITDQKAQNWEDEYQSLCRMMSALRAKADRR